LRLIVLAVIFFAVRDHHKHSAAAGVGGLAEIEGGLGYCIEEPVGSSQANRHQTRVASRR